MSATPPAARPSPGPWRVLWRRLRHNRVAMTGLGILVVLYLGACFAGFVGPYTPGQSDPDRSFAGRSGQLTWTGS